MAHLDERDAPTHLDAIESDPVRMGWMVGSPPPPDKLIRFADNSFTLFPRTRWSYSNMRQLLPTSVVRRADRPVLRLPRDERGDLDAVAFVPLGGGDSLTWAQSLLANYTDGILILHRGRLVYERYFGVQRSRSANPGAQADDPLRDWAADTTERVHYFSFYVTPPRIGRNTEARVSYDYAKARSNFLYAVVPGGPLPEPAQLPEVFNKLQELRLDVRHRLTNRLAATLSYLYEPFDVYDFAFDRSVIDSIAQPSALVLGYLYRPYTAHSAVVGLMYSW